MQFPYAIAADSNGDLYIANSGTSSGTIYGPSGNLIAGGLGASASLNLFPNAIAVDPSHNFWLSGADTVAHISATGTLLANVSCCGESYGMATDAQGNLWVADYLSASGTTSGDIAEVVTDSSNHSTVPLSGITAGGINHPAMIAIDAAQNVWISNFRGASITELAGANSSTPGAAISPSTGLYGPGGYGLDSSIDGPFTVVPDRSGNLWVSNENVYSITMLFGIAAPTATPVLPVPMAP